MVKGALIQNGVHLEDHEYETVKYFLDLGADIELIPPSQIKYLRMPDIIMNGISWEMKSPVGKGKYTIQNILQSAAGQSRNIIIDLRRCKMPSEEAINKIRREFDKSKNIHCMKVIQKNGELLDFEK